VGITSASTVLDMDVDEEEDPLRNLVEPKVSSAPAKINQYESFEDMKTTLANQVTSNQTVAIVVDSPTSRVKCVTPMIDSAAAIIGRLASKRVHILVPVGGRLDLLSAVHSRLATQLPNTFQQFCLQLNSGTDQRIRKKVGHMQYAVSKEALGDRHVPCGVPALASRARPGSRGARL
jgi:hypothetical protein